MDPSQQAELYRLQACAWHAAVNGWIMLQDAANLALEDVVKRFSTAHPDAGVVSFPFATIQRGFVSNYGQLGFVNAESGCASDLAISQYSTGNLYSLANPTFTAEGAKVCWPARTCNCPESCWPLAETVM